jgi:hypothetical protein
VLLIVTNSTCVFAQNDTHVIPERCMEININIETIFVFTQVWLLRIFTVFFLWNSILCAYNRLKDLVRCVLAKHILFLRQKNRLKNPQNILYYIKCSSHAVPATSSDNVNYTTKCKDIIFSLLPYFVLNALHSKLFFLNNLCPTMSTHILILQIAIPASFKEKKIKHN